MRFARLVNVLLVSACGALTAPVVTKVEPPNWWTNRPMNPVRLLIHGSGLSGASVNSSRGLITSLVSINPRGTYLFVDLTIPAGVQPGSYPLNLQTATGTAVAPFRIEEPLSSSGRFQGFSPDDVIYLIMPDRFANGDPSNDDPAVSRGLFDRSNPRYYHGGDLQGIIDHLPYLKQLGVTALWITPVYDNSNQLNTHQTGAGKAVADYHGYGTVDYYGIEEHFGTLSLLRKLVDEAHSMGIKVIQDQVANHVGPAHPWVDDPPTATWFHGTPSQHLKETFNIWQLVDPHASDSMRRSVIDGWFVDTLPDLNQEDPEVAQYEIQNALWWVAKAGFDGIRQDTLPYVSRAFWSKWSAALKRAYPKLTAVGEVFDANPVIPSFFQGGIKQADGIDTGIDSVFDFPSYFASRDAFAKRSNVETLGKTVGDDRLYPRPDLLSTFIGNHDVPRFMNEPGATVDGLKLAFTFLLTARGIPVIYYGDEIGMPGGDDPDNRRDFPGGWKGDRRNAFVASGRTQKEAAIFDYIRKLTAIRANCEPLRRGTMTNLVVDKQIWVYARQSGSAAAVVAINNGSEPAEIQVPFEHKGVLEGQLGAASDLTFHNGTAKLLLPPRTAEIFTRANGKR